MATREKFSIEQPSEREMPCKSRKFFLIALWATLAVVLVVIIALTVATIQSQTPHEEDTTVVPASTDLNATTTEVPLLVTVVPSEVEPSPAATQELLPIIYFPTARGGLKTYSVKTSETSTAVNSDENLFGVTYDFHQDFVYWSTLDKVYRKQSNGSQVTTVLSTNEYGRIYALDFDWLARSLYMGTGGGHIVACGTELTLSSSSLICDSVLTGPSYVMGIAVHPIQGIMYWTQGVHSGSVMRGGMDGSHVSVIVTGLNQPFGIAIDFQSSRIYWTVSGERRVQSSDMQGKDVQNVIELPRICGIALYGNRVYVTNNHLKILQSFTTAGQDLQVLHTDTNLLRHLAIVAARSDLPTNRTNHCDNQRCSRICVLTRTAFKCVT